MEESAVDIENPPPVTASKTNPHNNTPDRNNKIKILLLSAFLLVVIVLSVALGVTLQGNPTNNVEGVGDGEEALTVEEEVTYPTVEEEATYLVSPGPIPARIRMATPTIANGYTSCADLKDDIRNALKHLANTIIVDQSRNGWWYENNCGRDEPVYILEDSIAADETFAAAASPEGLGSTATAFKGEELAKEDSYGTNNQVQGVDEADFVKSDGKHVFTAYGDVIFAWDAQDANRGLSITRMPYNDTSDKDCPYFGPMPVDFMSSEEDVPPSKEPLTEEEVMATTVISPEAASTSGSSGSGRNRKAKMIADIMPVPCYKPKPQILSLMLRGSRLTAVVSEQSSRFYSPYMAEAEASTLFDYQDLTIKVYDAYNVPLDGSPLLLLGEKKIKGNYHDARSLGNNAVIITTSHLNTDSFTNELYRWRPQYCGLNSTAYEALAKETALNEVESFLEKMVKDLELELDGNCDGIFQVASIQAGDSKEVYDSNLLGEY
eukprot:scaffold1543_cov128-Skeletonema_menzelii.AAC.11